MALNEAKKALTAGEISEIIAQKSKGHLYKFSPTLRDALEYRLKREGLVNNENIADRSSAHKTTKVSKYSITQTCLISKLQYYSCINAKCGI